MTTTQMVLHQKNILAASLVRPDVGVENSDGRHQQDCHLMLEMVGVVQHLSCMWSPPS